MRKIIVTSFLSVILGIFGCNGQAKVESATFQKQLETFMELGFKLNNGVDTTDINRWENGYKEFENQPYDLMYITLGQTLEREPWTPITNQCWDFDLESIEDHGAYVDIMNNIARITNGDRVFEDLRDYVDIEKGKAWVSFKCNGDNYKWDLKVDSDWADGELFDKIQALTGKYKTTGKFTFFNTGGQDFVLGYHTHEGLEKLKKLTGLDIVWLKAKGQIY